MSVEVLARLDVNAKARNELQRRGVGHVTPWISKALHKAHLARGVVVGDKRKSWDVLKTVEFIESRVPKNEPVLDLGAYASEVLCALHKMGFSDLTGVDLNPAVSTMPFNDKIKYVTADFTQVSLPSGKFAAITAISVIEHGFDAAKMFREFARMLKAGGYFIASTDYWPEKIDTRGVKMFGMDWKIFSKSELNQAIEEAGKYGFSPVGPLNFEASEPTISWMNRNYTFAWFALQKTASK